MRNTKDFDKLRTHVKRQFTTGVSSKTDIAASSDNFSVGSYTEFQHWILSMEENFKLSSKFVDSERWNTQENYLRPEKWNQS